jgi:outer membrane protein OmpA-like peptidoglycan-associated protein
MDRIVRAVALVATVVVAAGCVTDRELETALAEERTRTQTDIDAGIDAEQQAREAADQQLQSQLRAQQAAIQELQRRFDTEVSVLEDKIRFAMPVHFDTDQADLEGQDEAALKKFASVADQYFGDATITIEGYADPAGARDHNLDLSQRRAEAVREYLVSQGLDGERLRAVGYGESRPVAPGASGETREAEMNRRVVFVIEAAEPVPPERRVSRAG